MKWNSPVEPKPVEGDLKVITRFAWFPHRVNNEKVWLEKYQELWEYDGFWRYHVGNASSEHIHWWEGKWNKIGEKVCRGLPYPDNMPPPPGSNEKEKREWLQFLKTKKKERFNAS